jgi:phosphonate transport system substrate-binding protein
MQAARALTLLLAALLVTITTPGSAVAAAGPACSDTRPLVFGFLPLVSPEKLVQRFVPLVNYLATQIGTEIRIETAPDFAEFARRTNKERRYDLLFTAPHFFYRAHRDVGYQLLVRVDSPGMVAIIVVPRDSDIRSVQGLAGRKLATVPPLGLATLLARKYLIEHDIDPDADLSLVSTPSHNASLLSSFYGVTDASALMMPPFRFASAEVRESMRIIAKTESSPHMPISAAPWLDTACMREITRLLTGMRDDPAGREVLGKIRFGGFVETSYADYERLQWAADQITME